VIGDAAIKNVYAFFTTEFRLLNEIYS